MQVVSIKVAFLKVIRVHYTPSACGERSEIVTCTMA